MEIRIAKAATGLLGSKFSLVLTESVLTGSLYLLLCTEASSWLFL